MTIDDIVKTVMPDMVEHRRYMHMHPEVSFHEKETYTYILECLARYPDVTVREGVGGGGLLATIGSMAHPHVAIRADFDALPIQDEKDVPYRSTVDGVMHACGHDAHTSTLLGLLDLVHKNKDHLKGSISFIFQFAEEVQPGGAISMVEDGVLEGIDKVYGQHYWSQYPTHQIKTKTGPVISSPDMFKIKIQGTGGHAAHPQNAVDPIVIAAELITNLQTVVSRQVSPLDNAVVTVGKVSSGDAFNVIPDTAEIIGTVRTFDFKVKEKIRDIFHKEATLTAEKRGATAEVQYDFGYPAVINHESEADIIRQAAGEIGLDFEEAKPLMIGEDFSYYINERPGAFFFTGSGNAGKLSDYVHHHPRFDMDEDAMASGLAMFMKILEIEQVIEWKHQS
ncbi:amidohydrolase [Salinicoccus sp. ID82-1]|uniref:Amidohydrolase n=1 Tax=Salinicoccus cyprini TaxID=2493691 RepID=A0A558ARX5_9STAP|nr:MULTISPECIES: amidohydrolase [Salinicoccus]MCG1009581.1 amidohydrolase [Salinicoccus sp. ID82-1]TVT27014.1 amidohydrolase [Salinicoccus cyprini]